jgi:iron(III) transport system substrate-binding protein
MDKALQGHPAQPETLSAFGVLRALAPRFAVAAIIASLFLSAAPAPPVTTAITGHLAGPDRTARLIAGAKKEGSVTVYSSITPETMAPLVAAFQKKYGMKVDLWRGTAGDILQRLSTETRSGRFTVDVVEGASVDIAPLGREGLFQDVTSPFYADLLPGSVVPGRPWVSARLSVFVAAYNTNQIKRADLPKSYDDLARRKLGTRIGIEAGDANWLMGMADAMGEPRATNLLRDIAATNGFSPRVGHTLMTNPIASGEVPFALTVYSEAAERLKRAGAPIELIYLSPTIAMDNSAAVMKRAPHPYAAMLFFDFLLSDGQKYISDDFYPSTNVKFQRPLPPGVTLTIMDVPKYLDQNAKWTRLYKDIVTPRPR